MAFRLNFGSVSDLPKGTNALDSYMGIYVLKKYGLSAWTPITDWGLPNLMNLSPQLLFEYILPATLFIRSFEFLSFLLAGMAMYSVSRRFVKNESAATVSGLFYMISVETSQLFEGHAPLMLSFAMFPWAFLAIYDIIKRPNLRGAMILAFVFYLLFALGDIGMFYMIVVISLFEFIFLEARTIVNKTWNSDHVKFIALSGVLFVVVNVAWIFQYLSGNRPQFTTNVTTIVAPFSQVSGQQIYYSLVGFIADNSYTYFSLHNFEYSFIHGYYYLIFLILPVLIFTYVTIRKDKILTVLAVSAIPAMVISTANLYPGLTLFNEFLYFHFPLFNYIPALFRWNFYTDFVYALILAYIMNDAFGIMSNKAIRWNWKRNLRFSRIMKRALSKTSTRKIAAFGIILLLLFIIFSQNSEIFTEPPGTFSFPNQFTIGYANLSKNSNSNVLTIPFGAIYSRTNYAGVSQSTEFMSPYFSGHNALMFQAGDPYSLEMDYFIGNGITYGLTNNITKFLSSVNTGYVVTTRYGNWSQSSDPIYDPAENYQGYLDQYNKGSLIYNGENETAYQLSTSGLVYFSTSYYVYFGGSGLLYNILDQPWYNGTNSPLINGSLLPTDQAGQIIEHSTALIISPNSLNEVQPYISIASRNNVPVIEIFDYKDMPPASISKIYEPWNSSNAYSFNLKNGTSQIQSPSFVKSLIKYGYRSVNLSYRGETGNIYAILVSYGKSQLEESSFTPFSESTALPWTNLSIVSAGINNQGKYPYNGSIEIQKYNNASKLIWRFTPNNSTFQYLNFEYGDILNSSYLSFSEYGKSIENYAFQAIFSNGTASFGSPVIESINIYNSSDNLTNVYFNLNPLINYSTELGKNFDVQRFVIGLTQSGNESRLVLSNFDLLKSKSLNNGFINAELGNVSLNSNVSNFTFNATQNVLFDTITLVYGNMSHILEYSKNTSVLAVEQSTPSKYSLDFNSEKTGILVFAQLYNSQWKLSGIDGVHLVTNIGLNGWFINSSSGGQLKLSISYLGQTYLYQGMTLELILIGASVVTLGISVRIRRKK